MKKLKILQTVDSYFPIVDGAINVSYHYCKNLNELAECALVTPAPSKKSNYVDTDEFKVYRCKSIRAPENYRIGKPNSDKKLKKDLENYDFDLIHAQSPFYLGKYALKLGKKRKVPVIAMFHTKYKEDFMRSSKSRLLTKIMIKYILNTYNRADYVWTVSENAAEELRSYGFKKDIKVVKNVTDYTYPENDKELIDKVNKLHNLEGKKNVFLYVGRLSVYKNIYLLMDAIKMLKDDGEDFTMIFVGGGWDEHKVRHYAKTHDIEDKCIFTGALKDKKLIQGYYLRADVLPFPSTFDTSALVKFEAAVHGTPSLVVKNSACAEDIIDNENGFLCDENAKSIYERLKELCHNPELVKKASEGAKKTFSITWHEHCEDILKYYEEIIEDYKTKNNLK